MKKREQFAGRAGSLSREEEPLGPTEITDMLNAKGVEVKPGAVRERPSQMVKDEQAQNLGRGQYIHPDNKNLPDNADTLTNVEDEAP